MTVRLKLHTHARDDVLAISVSSDNTAVIHNIAIIAVVPTLLRKKNSAVKRILKRCYFTSTFFIPIYVFSCC